MLYIKKPELTRFKNKTVSQPELLQQQTSLKLREDLRPKGRTLSSFVKPSQTLANK